MAKESDLSHALPGRDSDEDQTVEEHLNRPALRVVSRTPLDTSPDARSLRKWTEDVFAQIAEDLTRLEARVEEHIRPLQEIEERLRVPRAEAVPLRVIYPDEGVRSFDDEAIEQEEIATATLAEIYASQGLVRRAVGMMEEVLRRSSGKDRKVQHRLEELKKSLLDMEEE